MAISIVCPSCGARSKGPDSLAGKSGRCPKCKNKFQVPPRPEETPPASVPDWLKDVEPPVPCNVVGVAGNAVPSQVPCEHCGGLIGCDSRFAGQSVLCPHCKGQVQMPGSPPAAPLPLPISASPDAQRPILIEQTAKIWKALQFLGGILTLVGAVGLFAIYRRHFVRFFGEDIGGPPDSSVPLFQVLTAVGVGIMTVGGIAAWWYHK
jgi:hypothetical protein